MIIKYKKSSLEANRTRRSEASLQRSPAIELPVLPHHRRPAHHRKLYFGCGYWLRGGRRSLTDATHDPLAISSFFFHLLHYFTRSVDKIVRTESQSRSRSISIVLSIPIPTPHRVTRDLCNFERTIFCLFLFFVSWIETTVITSKNVCACYICMRADKTRWLSCRIRVSCAEWTIGLLYEWNLSGMNLVSVTGVRHKSTRVIRPNRLRASGLDIGLFGWTEILHR